MCGAQDGSLEPLADAEELDAVRASEDGTLYVGIFIMTNQPMTIKKLGLNGMAIRYVLPSNHTRPPAVALSIDLSGVLTFAAAGLMPPRQFEALSFACVEHMKMGTGVIMWGRDQACWR